MLSHYYSFFFCFDSTVDIVACPDYLTWGVSFDDGPSVNSMFIIIIIFVFLLMLLPSPFSPVSILFWVHFDLFIYLFF